jgi:hypothetical protein
MIFAVGFYSLAAAQDTCSYYLTPDVQVQKEVVFKSTNDMFDLNLKIGIKWFQVENKIQLLFDRRTVTGNDLFILLFSMSQKTEQIGTATDCKSGNKPLWSKLKSEDSKFMQYFIQSDNLVIDNYMDCYKSLANNNEEEFMFDLKEFEDFKITLPGFLVVKTEKRPWHSFSKRDKRVMYKTKPFDIYIEFERLPEVVDGCSIAEKVVPYIEHYKKILDEESVELLEAQKNKSCIFFNLLKDKIRRTFVELNDRVERYTYCEEIAATIKEYNDAFETVFKEECAAAAPVRTSNCTLNENELTSINNRLRNLQMKINVNKRNNAGIDDEAKEYRAIKAAILPRITPDCRRSYKQAIDALESYCVNIESLL